MQRLDYISIARLRRNVADYGAYIWNDWVGPHAEDVKDTNPQLQPCESECVSDNWHLNFVLYVCWH